MDEQVLVKSSIKGSKAKNPVKSVETVKNQGQFDKYIRGLSQKEDCMHMIGTALDLCNDEAHECQFRGEETYSLRAGSKKECRRPRVIELKKMLGSK